jgi:hypothetical protein
MKHLFRAKRVDNGEWVEGYYVVLIEGIKINHYIVNENENYTGYLDDIQLRYYVIPESVVYIPNEELAKKWEERLKEYENNLSKIPTYSIETEFYNSMISNRKECISELKEAGK